MENAEQVEPMSELDLKIKEAMEETSEESAPQVVESPEVEKPEELADEPAEHILSKRAQKRIDKVTGDKWDAIRRAEKAETKLAEMQQVQAPQTQSKEPQLEDFDYDEQAFNSALIDHKVEIKAKSIQREQQDEQAQQVQARTATNFKEASVKFSTDNEIKDFNEVLDGIPTLQPTVLQYVMEDPKGPELAYFLGKNQDLSNEIARMNPIAAAVEIGKISSKLSEPKQIKPSSAPEPIEPVTAGGVVESDIGDEMSMDAWMNKYNP